MTEHLIRLRGGWTLQAGDSAQQPVRSQTLPTTTLEPGPSGFTLRRPFQAPGPLNPRERVLLRVANVPGVQQVALNGRGLMEGAAEGDPIREFDVTGEMQGRCLLVMEVGRAGWICPPEGWGHVAIVIRDTSPGEGIGEP